MQTTSDDQRYGVRQTAVGYSVYVTTSKIAIESYRTFADAERAARRWNTYGDGWLGLRQ